MIITWLVPLMISCVLVSVAFFISWKGYDNMNNQKLAPFECGFDPMSKMRSPFSIRFLLLLMLFLVFDVESILLLPLVMVSFYGINVLMNYIMCFFLLILLGGLLYEWYNQVLEWMI
uniref:NADH-ubiquinone oxidoreductase chain 3 n=1 Tax=Microceramus pontificus TaxID=513540 RepID=A0A343F267_9EUPU|nr:NADH dehydrogenase subunit 3 [Microceramus pontificus]ASP44437.1 NADH dehydrogenase subunit 3 [Microceramus pontificus]